MQELEFRTSWEHVLWDDRNTEHKHADRDVLSDHRRFHTWCPHKQGAPYRPNAHGFGSYDQFPTYIILRNNCRFG